MWGMKEVWINWKVMLSLINSPPDERDDYILGIESYWENESLSLLNKQENTKGTVIFRGKYLQKNLGQLESIMGDFFNENFPRLSLLWLLYLELYCLLTIFSAIFVLELRNLIARHAKKILCYFFPMAFYNFDRLSDLRKD